MRHWRLSPRRHAFGYRIAQLCLDLDELDRVFAGRRLWSVDRRNLAEFRRGDYLAPATMPLAEAARALVERHAGFRPRGAVRLLTHLRYGGYVFNPVSFYYCHDSGGALAAIIAAITNTPWNERHAYVLPISEAQRRGALWEWQFDKAFHVSPFLPLDRRYRWRFSAPGDGCVCTCRSDAASGPSSRRISICAAGRSRTQSCARAVALPADVHPGDRRDL
ncbi:protein containing DUF1365, partial [mine drainage metagenome]